MRWTSKARSFPLASETSQILGWRERTSERTGLREPGRWKAAGQSWDLIVGRKTFIPFSIELVLICMSTCMGRVGCGGHRPGCGHIYSFSLFTSHIDLHAHLNSKSRRLWAQAMLWVWLKFPSGPALPLVCCWLCLPSAGPL